MVLSKKAKAKTKIKSSITRRLVSSPAQIWKSRLSWRITLAVFLTILTVQVGIMFVTVNNYRVEQLDELVEAGRSAIVPIMNEEMGSMFTSPISSKSGQRLITTTKVNGVAIYSLGSDCWRSTASRWSSACSIKKTKTRIPT